ncbi:CHAT domain-containing protein [Streptomyces sp. NBC_00210]|uniref:CHAT domain-containing protein n=1 Tax=unclassified Streptomyces TaxID=2593676 RepID=UPI00324AED42
MERLTGLLMTELRGADPRTAGADDVPEPVAVPSMGKAALKGPPADRWCEVAAALAAGESKRALAMLDEWPDSGEVLPDDRTLVRALRVAALQLEHNWQPVAGAAFLTSEATAALASVAPNLEAAIAAVADPRLRRYAELAGQTLPSLLGARTMLGHLASTGAAQRNALAHGADEPWVHRDLGPDAALVLRSFDVGNGHAVPPVYRTLLASDLRMRAADPAGARELHAEALHRAGTEAVTGGPACEGFAELLAGDWLLGPPDAAQRALRAPAPQAADLDAAAAHFARAEDSYHRACSRRGRAAAALRLAHVARLRGRSRECRRALDRALDLALDAGDGACAALVRVQRGLDALARRGMADLPEADAVRTWGASVGSGSWARGLRGIALEHSASWLEAGDLVRGRGALLLADRLSDAVEVPERADAWAKLYRLAGHDQAALLLTDVRMDALGTRMRGRPATEHFGDLLGFVFCAQLFHHHALTLGDPGLLTASGVRLDRALSAARALPAGDGQLAAALGPLAADLAELPLWTALQQARRDRAAGLPDEADGHAALALAAAARTGNGYGTCAALVELRRLDEARTQARRLDEEGRMTALQSASLWLRLNEPVAAARAARDIGRRGPEPAEPWGLPAIQAELRLQLGDLDTAHDQAQQGVRAYEEHRARLARDSLRSASANSPVIPGLYHCALLSRLPRTSCVGAPAAAAFDWAERSRSGFLDAVRALDSATGYPGARASVRAWLSAGTRWSARYEEELAGIREASSAADRPVRPAPRPPGPAANAPGPAPGTQAKSRLARLAAAEADLDAAEAAVRRLSPAALTSARGGELPEAARIAAALPTDTLLITHHVFDEDLVGWAVTRNAVRAERCRRWAGEVTALARRFHAGCAVGDSDGPAAAHTLTKWLLEPFAAELDRYRRVVVVPAPRLSLLPFHVLPWDGDVLGARHVVSYLPAASLLVRPRPPQAPWRQARALLVGAPAMDPQTGLTPLPGTGVEVASIARLLPRAELLTGARATRGRVMAAAPEHEVLHLAAHGLIDDLSPSRGRLALAGTDELDMADLIGCTRAPRLLVLSACNSGRGTATAGGDVLGLTRTAMITGAQGAVVSLWPVGDDTGCLVMTGMYERLADGTAADVATALHDAQQEVRSMSRAERDHLYGRLAAAAGAPPSAAGTRDSEALSCPAAADRDPRHWAPFVYVGA